MLTDALAFARSEPLSASTRATSFSSPDHRSALTTDSARFFAFDRPKNPITALRSPLPRPSRAVPHRTVHVSPRTFHAPFPRARRARAAIRAHERAHERALPSSFTPVLGARSRSRVAPSRDRTTIRSSHANARDCRPILRTARKIPRAERSVGRSVGRCRRRGPVMGHDSTVCPPPRGTNRACNLVILIRSRRRRVGPRSTGHDRSMDIDRARRYRRTMARRSIDRSIDRIDRFDRWYRASSIDSIDRFDSRPRVDGWMDRLSDWMNRVGRGEDGWGRVARARDSSTRATRYIERRRTRLARTGVETDDDDERDV